MKYFAALLVAAIALMTGSEAAAWVTYSNDFESGIVPELAVRNASGLFTVDTGNSVLRISKPEDDGTVESNRFITAGITTNFHLVGDFTATVDYSLNDFTIPPSPGLIDSILECAVPPISGWDVPYERFSLLHIAEAKYVQTQFEVWDGSGHGRSSSSSSQGRYRIVRNGANMAGYIDEGSGTFSLVWQGAGFIDNVQVSLIAAQGKSVVGAPRATTALDISFDNLDIIAEDIFFILPGDANLDGYVGVSDLGILAGYYGLSGDHGWDHGDFNYDRKVDVSDLGILASHYGEGTPPGASVPEPSSITLLLMGVLAILFVRRR